MHDVICVNLYRTKSYLNPQKRGVTGPSPTTNVCMHMYQEVLFWQKKNKLKLKLFQSLGNYLNVTCFFIIIIDMKKNS